MAQSDSSDGISQLPTKSEDIIAVPKTQTKFPSRKATLLSLTILLNILLWSSLVCITATIYQIAFDVGDSSSIPTEVLTLTSSVASISYIFLHTIFSIKQRIWEHQERHPSVKRTSYIAVRFTITLCILWLLTSGWNMITVARRPICLPKSLDLQGWEAGPTCYASRVSITFAALALISSCILFWMLSTVRHPLEAHIFKHGYQSPSEPNLTSSTLRRPSPSRTDSLTLEEYRRRSISMSTHRSTPSCTSDTDVETINLNSISNSSTIHAPAPIHTMGLEIFTSNAHPPPLPSEFASHSRASSYTLASPAPTLHSTALNQHLPLPPRMSKLLPPSGYIPISAPAQFSASAWRAVHPSVPSPLNKAATRSLYIQVENPKQNFTYRNQYSHSSVSLTRPSRLSGTTTPASGPCSLRGGSVGPEQEPPSSSRRGLAGNNDIALAILSGTSIPDPVTDLHLEAQGRPIGHVLILNAPDTTAGAQQEPPPPPLQNLRKNKGWKPELEGQFELIEPQTHDESKPRLQIRSPSTTAGAYSPQSSFVADLLSSKFSPDPSPVEEILNLRFEFEKQLALRRGEIDNSVAVMRIRSEDPIRISTSEERGERAPVMGVREAREVDSRVPPSLRKGLRVLKNERRVAHDGESTGAGAKTYVGIESRMKDSAVELGLGESGNKPLPEILGP